MNKKIFIFFFLLLGSFLTFNFMNVKAEDGEFIELYPYDDVRALDPNSDFTAGSKVGSANWTFAYGGYRYHAVRTAVRYAKDFKDANLNGTIEPTELGSALSWNAFASIFVNQTGEEFELSTASGRADITTVVHRIYAYFDEDGYLYLFEDQINQYYIRNNGDDTIEGQDWELVSKEEIAGWEEEAVPEDVLFSHIRMALDNSEKGYVLEPIKYITWNHLWMGEDKAGTPHPASIIREGNVDNVNLGIGDTTISFGTLDRDGTNKKTLAFITGMPYEMIKEELTLVKEYTEQPPTFGNTLAPLDKDVASPGINYVVEYESDFKSTDLTNGVKATYVHMFDEDGNAISEERATNYKIEVKKGAQVIETINATWDAETKEYTFDAEIKAIDSKDFGAAFTLTYSAVSPVDGSLSVSRNVDVAVGVYPPRFVGVPTTTQFSNEGEYVDLLAGIKADDGYGNDISDLIKVSGPNGFSQYAPRPGVYKINLQFVYKYFLAGVKPELVFTFEDDTTGRWSYPEIDKEHASANAANVHLYTKAGYNAVVKEWASMNWTSELLIVENGEIVMAYSRGTNKLMNAENPLPTKDAGNTNAVGDMWFKTLELTDDQIAIVIQGTSSIAINGWAKAAYYGQKLEILEPTDDIDHDFIINASYTLQVDDITPPELLIKDNDFKVEAGKYTDVDEVILSNVLGRDNYSTVSMFVVEDGGLNLDKAGKYNVEVLGTDEKGNETMISFVVEVVAKDTSVEDDLNGKIDELEAANEELKDKLAAEEAARKAAEAEAKEAAKDTQDKIDALEKSLKESINGIKTTPIAVTIIIAVVAAGLAFGGAFLLLRKP